MNQVDVYPRNLVVAGSNLFYEVGDPSASIGMALMVTRSDGTTSLVSKDVYEEGWGNVVGNSLYFATRGEYAHSDGLFVTDGTVDGTKRFQLPAPAPSSANGVTDVIAAGDTTYFVSTQDVIGDTAYGPDLWKQGPQDPSPVLVYSRLANPNTSASQYVDVWAHLPVGNSLYFEVDERLWVSDGTSSGTHPYSSLDSYGNVQYLDQMYSLNTFGDSLVVETDSQLLLLSPGKNSPTVFYTKPDSVSYVWDHGSTESGFYFSVRNYDETPGTDLFVSDGTPENTISLGSFSQHFLDQGLVLDGDMYFRVSGSDADQLWKTDGTPNGTVLFRQLQTRLDIGNGDFWSVVPAINGTSDVLYFTDYDPVHGYELWKTDGTVAGTQLVKDIDPGPASSSPHSFVMMGDELYFAAHDGSSPPTNQLWKSDGTAQGTQLVASWAPRQTLSMQWDGFYSNTAPAIAALPGSDSSFVFAGSDGLVPTPTLWLSDGTDAGTIRLDDFDPGALATLGNSVYALSAWDELHYALYKIDGASHEVTRIKDLVDLPNDYDTATMLTAGDRLYLVLPDGSDGRELWASDGSSAGTTLLHSFASDVSSTFVTGDHLLFSVRDSDGLWSLWTSDGTSDGTQPILRNLFEMDSSTDSCAELNGVVYFLAAGLDGRSGLYRTDGTAGGTSLVLSSADDSRSWSGLTATSNRLFFRSEANSSMRDAEVWTSDGTAQNTGSIPLPDPSLHLDYSDFMTLGDLLLFATDDWSNGSILWITDGTSAGTSPLKDGEPADSESDGSWYYYGSFNPLVADGRLYFAASDDVHGIELWSTDGTPAGTVMVADVNPYGSSDPTVLLAQGDYLVVLADDGVHGVELQRVDLSQATLSITSGDSQSAPFGTAFDSPLVVTVTDATGQPVPDVVVHFATLGTGAGALFPGDATATTDSNGRAQITATANLLVGSYWIQATADGYDSAIIRMTNSPREATLTLDPASLSRTYDGTAHPVTVIASPAGLTGVRITYNGSTTPPTQVGTYAVAAFLTNASYTAQAITGTLTIAQAPATLALDPASLIQTYDGAAHPVTVIASPAGLTGVTITYNGQTTPPTQAGTYAIGVSLANVIYTAPAIAGTLTIARAATSFTGLADQTISIGTGQVLVAGVLTSAVTTTGRTVTVSINGVSQSATLDANGQFQVMLPAASLALGTYAVTYLYPGSVNDQPASATASLDVRYGTSIQTKTSKTGRSLVLRVLNGAGQNLGSSKLMVSARGVVDAAGLPARLKPSIAAKRFTYNKRAKTYTLSFKTKGLARGTYSLSYRIGADARSYVTVFQV